MLSPEPEDRRCYPFTLIGHHLLRFLVAEFISPQKCTLSVLLAGNIVPKSVKCIHSATKDSDVGCRTKDPVVEYPGERHVKLWVYIGSI